MYRVHWLKKYWGNIIVVLIFTLPLLFIVVAVNGQEISLPENPLEGRKIFKEKGCIKCHTIQEKGGRIGPDLSKNLFYGSFLQLAGIMWNHAPQMFERAEEIGMDIPQFTHKEMAELIAYLYYLRYLGQPGNEFRGKKILEKKHCFKCHKIGGKGGNIGPNLSRLKQYVSPLYIAQTMWNHGPKMEKLLKRMNIKFAEFENNEIVDLTAAIKSFTSPTLSRSEYMLPGDPKRGKALFNAKGCSRCHAVRGEGGTIGPDFADVSLERSVTEIAGIMWNHGSKMWELMKQQGIPHPKFSGQEMADVIAYIYFVKFNDQSGDPEKGKKVLTDKGCISCHSVKGQGGDTAPDLGEQEELISPIGMVQIMWNHAPKMVEKMAEKKLPWPEFETDDMPNLNAYLRSIIAPNP